MLDMRIGHRDFQSTFKKLKLGLRYLEYIGRTNLMNRYPRSEKYKLQNFEDSIFSKYKREKLCLYEYNDT